MQNEPETNMTENKPKISTKVALAQALDKHTAFENVRELGRVFVEALFAVEVKPKATSELMNGLVAYERLDLKGQWDYMDESVDIVMNAVFEEALERVETDSCGAVKTAKGGMMTDDLISRDAAKACLLAHWFHAPVYHNSAIAALNVIPAADLSSPLGSAVLAELDAKEAGK